MRAIDTNVLVRLLTEDDARQARQAHEFTRGGAWVSHLVLVETVWVLDSHFDLPRAKQALAIEMLLQHHELVVERPDVVALALDHFRRKPTIGFSDCLILEVARAAGHLPLGTFDRSLSRLPGGERVASVQR
ncbi:MAG: type II toxin-antitoxin system VapC family toxin [Xanthomonadales bacterium]|nr:type II toxin-antitoxin system VapC family toxin [Xanthomonadales bacterium]